MTTRVSDLTAIRAEDPSAVARAMSERRRPRWPDSRRLLLVAADMPARGVVRAGEDPMGMANRRDLLERLVTALSRPGVTGFLGTPDIVEDLALLGALHDKVVIGSMNRGGITGTTFEIDDRFTAYDAQGIREAGLDGGKMLLRIDPADPSSSAALDACARAVDELAAAGVMAMVEPVIVRKMGGRVVEDITPEALIRAVSIAAALGRTSAYTWLKLPASDQLDRVLGATTLPCVIVGGDAADDLDGALARWSKALRQPSVRGLVLGRSLLYPRGGDVGRAVDGAVGLLA
jgi:uncharacterized protein